MLKLVKNREEEFKKFCSENCIECNLVKRDFVTSKNESCLQIYALICNLVEALDENKKLKEINLVQFCLLDRELRD